MRNSLHANRRFPRKNNDFRLTTNVKQANLRTLSRGWVKKCPIVSFGEQDGFDENLSGVCSCIAARGGNGNGLRRRYPRSQGSYWGRWRWWRRTYQGEMSAVHGCGRELQLHGAGKRIGNFVFHKRERNQLEFDDPDRKGSSCGRYKLPLAAIFELYYRDSEERIGGDTAE